MMDSANLSTLTEDQWRTIEKIGDLLADASPEAHWSMDPAAHDLQQALRTGLDLMLVALGRQGGALYLPRFCEHVSQDWTMVQAPAVWADNSLNGHSPLQALAEQVLRSRQVLPGSKLLEIGAVFPVIAGERVFGALFVCGQPIRPEEYPRWMTFLRPIARTVKMHAQVSGNADGTPSYLELLRSRNTLRAMFDSLPISIYIVDSAYNLVAINLSRADRVGEKPHHLVGRKCYEKLYQRGTPCQGCRVADTFENGQSTQRVSRDWLDAEKFIEWDISTFPVFEERDNVAQTVVIEQDVTEKRNLESNLIQSEKLAAVGQLAAGVAHEINNPLTAIIANAQLLRREVGDRDEDLLDSVKLIEMAGTRASQVVRNLLGIARKEKYEIEPIDLNDTLNNALSLVQHELVGRPIEVQLDLAGDLPEVMASQDQLQGVWINLILNAIDAIDKDNGQISITSRYNASSNEFQVVIMDNGKGIPADHLARVFEPFFTTKSPGRGTGLGLSVCMRVIRHHGGTILVESQVGKWTRFTVILPGPQ